MNGDLFSILVILATIGCALIGGVFFAFSGFVMPALKNLPAPCGIAAMQSINVQAVTAPLMAAMFGTALICLALAILSVLDWQGRSAYILAGALLYLLGTLGVTMGANVPRNDDLDAVDPESESGAGEWARFVPVWTTWNSVRTLAAIAAAAAFAMASNT